ncbi:MAG: tol-pal system-associated acyl-CoA thioesterase [gamma proteobacterium symbiont of Bathyaustriella thionipta]|nr:tol-pal system-associated acyl-CoA thioesterase [gamma proteobacterium symbiont of Bathyaustriella thionipta]
MNDLPENLPVFSWPVRVYYEDTDAEGVVYYANYLKFMERARTEWLRHLGFEQDDLTQRLQAVFAVHHVDIHYLKPALFNHLLNIQSTMSEIGRSSLTFEHKVMLDSADDVFCSAHIKVVCVSTDNFRPKRVPQEIRDALHGQ